jgi:rhodopsin domain-containing protein
VLFLGLAFCRSLNLSQGLANSSSTCITAIIRIFYIYKIFYQSYDVTWWAAPGWFWAAVETDIGLICASMPALKIYFQRYLDAVGNTIESLRGRRANNSTYNSNSEKRMTPSGTFAFSGKGSNSKTSTKYIDTMTEPDLELAAINVTSELEVASIHAHSYATSGGASVDGLPQSPRNFSRNMPWHERS